MPAGSGGTSGITTVGCMLTDFLARGSRKLMSIYVILRSYRGLRSKSRYRGGVTYGKLYVVRPF